MDKNLVDYLLKGGNDLEILNIKFFISGVFSAIILLLNTIVTFSIKEYGLGILNIIFLITGTTLLILTRFYIHIFRVLIYSFALISSLMNLELIIVHFFEPMHFTVEPVLVLAITFGIILSLFASVLYNDSKVFHSIYVVLHNTMAWSLFAYLFYMILVLANLYVSKNSFYFCILCATYCSTILLSNTLVKYIKVYRRQ